LVLCSKKATFDIKEAETSNSLLLIKDVMESDQCKENIDENTICHDVTVLTTFHRYLELRSSKPGWQKLHILLEERLLKHFPAEDLDQKSWKFVHLLDRIQCSEEELLDGLKSIDAIQPEIGLWTMVDPDFRMRILSLICNVVNENSWSFDAVPKHELLGYLNDLEPEVITSQVFDQYFKDSKTCQRSKVSRFYGEYLLQSSSVFNLDEFMSIWQESLPTVDNEGEEPFKADLAHLEGIALVTVDGQIRYFPEFKLPQSVQERLGVLFDSKVKWTLDDITPFVTNLTTDKLNVKALLTKYSRASRINGQQYFSSKHNN
jgi:sister chromatid cohesion protein DCC1